MHPSEYILSRKVKVVGGPSFLEMFKYRIGKIEYIDMRGEKEAMFFIKFTENKNIGAWFLNSELEIIE